MTDTEKILQDVPDLSPDDLARIAESIQRFGANEHPVPEPKSLPFFRAAYAGECVAKARDASDGGEAVALSELADRILAAVR